MPENTNILGSSRLDPEDHPGILELTPDKRAFLEGPYLEQPYLVPQEVSTALNKSAERLHATIPGFECVVNVGGTSNGSLLLRRLEKPGAATDLDFYFVGHSTMLDNLSKASAIVSDEASRVGLTLDGELNGKRDAIFLNLDDLMGHIEREDFNLLALPFQSAFGNISEAKRAILNAVISHPDKQVIWDEMANYHIQSLSIHHGTWAPAFGNLILDKYYPEKIAKFELPETPEEALAVL
jgi:hypothetical protein